MQAHTWLPNFQNVGGITFWSFIWVSQAWRGVSRIAHLFSSSQCMAMAAVLHLGTGCPQTTSGGEALLCNTPGELLHGFSPRRRRVSVVWTEGWDELSAPFLPPCCRSLAGPPITLQGITASDAPVTTVRSSRLCLCGFLLVALLRARHSDHFASF